MKTIKTIRKKILADTLTPVFVYLKIRDLYPYSLLLESSEYNNAENSKSIICAAPIFRFTVDNNTIIEEDISNGDVKEEYFATRSEFQEKLGRIFSHIKTASEGAGSFGFFGYMSYDSVRYFENIKINPGPQENRIPDMAYSVYRFIIVFDHFRNSLEIIENLPKGWPSKIDSLINIIRNRNFPIYSFNPRGDETGNISDSDFLRMVEQGKNYCQSGEVIQVVLSRRYNQSYNGDDFNVYRALRSINPSPYLFYYDLGEFRIFGSSPEAQLIINDNKASIYPIAGTFKRKQNFEEDLKEVERLRQDQKENSEHVMLVDLARNDLSRNGMNTKVERFKEIQYYSHVIHMVSKVCTDLKSTGDHLDVIADTFPAGTLSGAPKFRAMELISELEQSARGYYGGAIGYFGFNGDYNHAIMIRSFLSKNNQLTYQAGAGIVAQSDPLNELDEVANKLGALRQAIQEANKIHQL